MRRLGLWSPRTSTESAPASVVPRAVPHHDDSSLNDPPPSLWLRSLSALAALIGLGILATAWVLEPDPRGYGTHEKLGLPACVHRERTGRPCPTCGLTTSLAAAVKGRIPLAYRANPGGLVLAPATAALVFICGYAAATGRFRLGSRRLSPRDAGVALIGLVVLVVVVGPALRR